MDFTNIRQLIYRERKSLDEFGILVDDKSKITPFLYDRLIHIDYLHPKHKYSNEEILRILNDVFFFHTLFFNDDNPLAHYADYQQISNPNNSSDNLSKNRQWVEMAIAYVILNRFNGVEWFREKISHARFFDFIKEEIEKHRRAYTYSMLTLGEAVAIEDKIINTITSDSESRHFVMIINEDFPLRDIQEVIDSKESLENCLLAGSDLCNYVIEVCKDEEQEKALIDRLLEPEKEHYGVFDSRICAAYRSLYELKSELTGEPLPEQLPFEKASICIPPMMATPPSILDYQKEKKADERDVMIAELRETISQMKTEFEQYKQEHSITQEQLDAIFPINDRIDNLENKLSEDAFAADEDIEQIFNDDEQGKPQEGKQPQAEKLNAESDSQPQELTDALKKIVEQEETIKDLRETIMIYQMRGWPPAKRKGIALGLTPIQADIFGDYLADKLGIVFDNKKKELSLILNCLFGQGLSSLANKMHMTTGAVDDRLYVASIFGPSSPEIAKEICSDWDEDTLAPWEEEVEYDDEGDDESE